MDTPSPARHCATISLRLRFAVDMGQAALGVRRRRRAPAAASAPDALLTCVNGLRAGRGSMDTTAGNRRPPLHARPAGTHRRLEEQCSRSASTAAAGRASFRAPSCLSVAAFLEGRYAQAFPSFGSERMGAPVMAFCRIDDHEIRLREPVMEPDALIIQDPTLLHQVDLFNGLPDGRLHPDQFDAQLRRARARRVRPALRRHRGCAPFRRPRSR